MVKLEIPIHVYMGELEEIINELKHLQTYKLFDGSDKVLVDCDDVVKIFANHLHTEIAQEGRRIVMKDDTISRQLAVDELIENKEMINAVLDSLTLDYNTRRDQEQKRGQIIEDIETIKALPSVQPELSTEIQEILDYLDNTLHPIISPDNWNVYSELYDMVSKLFSIQSEQQWVPCSEGPPEEESEVLVTTSWNDVCKAWYSNGKWRAEFINEYDDGEILAWMPLPKSYLKDGD